MGAGSIEYLEHTADIGIRVVAADMPEAFRSAARALVSLFIDPAGLRITCSERIALTALDREQLLFRWLNELLFLRDARSFLPLEFDDLRLDRPTDETWRLEGEVRGDRYDPERHESRVYVKAVTYHQLRIEQRSLDVILEYYADV